MNLLSRILCLVLFCSVSYAQSVQDERRLYGVTIDDINNPDDIVTSLSELSQKPTVRIVFNPLKPVSYYIDAVERIREVSYVMGEILDSYYMKDYAVEQYETRARNYLDSLGDKVDIWEIGNEINGEWLGNNEDVAAKMTRAYSIVKARHKLAALTLYYNYNCFGNPENEIFCWIENNVPVNMKDSLDYVLVSYYEDDCNGFQPDWQAVFDSLHVLFPNSKLGIGECGTKFRVKKKQYLKRYYTMSINTPNFIGGYFWWYFRQDCVPFTKPLWKTLNSILKK